MNLQASCMLQKSKKAVTNIFLVFTFLVISIISMTRLIRLGSIVPTDVTDSTKYINPHPPDKERHQIFYHVV